MPRLLPTKQTSKQIAAQRVADTKAQAAAAARQFAVDDAARKVGESVARGNIANKQRDLQADYAQNAANMSALKGLLSLTKTGMDYYEQHVTAKEEERLRLQQEDEILDSIGWGTQDMGVSPEDKATPRSTQL